MKFMMDQTAGNLSLQEDIEALICKSFFPMFLSLSTVKAADSSAHNPSLNVHLVFDFL